MTKARVGRQIFKLVVLLIILHTLSVCSLAAGVLSISAKNAEGKPGEVVTVPIVITDNTGFVSASVEISYNTTFLKLREVQDTGLLPGALHTTNLSSPYYLTWANDSSLTDYMVNGAAVNLVFEISEVAVPGDYEITISVPDEGIIDSNGETVMCTFTSGAISIVTAECDHHWSDWTKSSSSKHKRTCDLCGEAEYERHNWDSGIITIEPTPGEVGVKVYTCEICGGTKSEVLDAIPKEDCEHVWNDWIGAGNFEHKHTCELCGTVEYKDHDWDAGVVTVRPTPAGEGEKVYTCVVCSAQRYETIPALDVEKYTISGTVTSYGDDETAVTNLQLYFGSGASIAADPSYTTAVAGTGTKAYSFGDIPVGTYTLRVSKAGHLTKDYVVIIDNDDVNLDVEISLEEATTVTLDAPADPIWDGSEMVWTKPAIEPAYLSHYEVRVYYGATEQEARAMTTHIMAYDVTWDNSFRTLNESTLQQWGEGYYHFKVRAVSSDQKFKLDSAWVEGYAPLHYTNPSTTLPAPTGLTWTGTSVSWDWPEALPDAFDYYTVGMYYGKTEAETRQKKNYVFLYARYEEDSISLRDEQIEKYGDGVYMFCVTAVSKDAAVMSNSPEVWSEPLVYNMPVALDAPEQAYWNDLTMSWTRPETVPEYMDTYNVNLYYGKTEEEALAKTTTAAIFNFPLDSYIHPLTSLYVYRQYGDGYYHFEVRYGSSDLTKVFSSAWVEAEEVLHYVTPSESAVPYDLQWHIDNIDEDGYITQTPGMMFWRCEAEQAKFRIVVLKYGEETNELILEKDVEFAPSELAEWHIQEDLLFQGLESGEYIFTVQALGDGKYVADSTIAMSSYWSYTAPDEQLDAATEVTWDGNLMQWAMPTSDYLYGCEYEVFFAATLDQVPVPIANGVVLDTTASANIQDLIEEYGSDGYYAFRVRTGSNDITEVRPSEWSAMSQCYSPNNGFDTPSRAQIVAVVRDDQTVATTIVVALDVKATAFCSIYDKYGKMLCIEQAELDVGTNEVTFFGALPADAYRARIFAIERAGVPLCETKAIRLIELTEGSGSAEGEVPGTSN